MQAHQGKPRIEDVTYFIDICPITSIQGLNLHDFFIDFDGDIQMMLRTIMIFFMLALNDRKSSRGRANIVNPKTNKGCPPFTVNHTSAQYVENSRGPSPGYIQMGHPHTGICNAMQSVNHEHIFK